MSTPSPAVPAASDTVAPPPGRSRLQRLRLITACVAICGGVTLWAAYQSWYTMDLPTVTAVGADYQKIEGVHAHASISGVDLVAALDAPTINATTAGHINRKAPSSRFGLPDATALALIGAALSVTAAMIRSRLIALVGVIAQLFAFRSMSALTDLVEDVHKGGYLNTRAIGVQVTELTIALGVTFACLTFFMVVSLLAQERRETRERLKLAPDAKLTADQQAKMPLTAMDWIRGATAMVTDKARAAAEESARTH